MLKELIEKERYSFHEGFEKWEDAVKASCKPLIKQGVIEPSYVDSIIENVNKYGPYIVIAPNICIPHAQEGKGVNETAICFMKTEKAVHFSDDPEQDAQLFFVLASTNNDLHMKNLVSMVEIVEKEELVKMLIEAKSKEDLEEILKVL
ncbi:PTS sugar transporter subunit IIA [Clostridium weizhouense]|uniref:Ascorbate-specific PTS system EIIA component n=1 Tax=Clostridium weizhouense TaxID=2859781 RepID=A0ABS7ANJ6_9CLOT|nr:PTS sugar transporter subunit IIA [Clostridium weizhouense]MBW6410241.1 PTS sugar transporter subunit IIA [Clostridium weizhouense]